MNLPAGCQPSGGHGCCAPGWYHFGVLENRRGDTIDQAFSHFFTAPGVTHTPLRTTLNGLEAMVVTTTSTNPYSPEGGEGTYYFVLVRKGNVLYHLSAGKFDDEFLPVWRRMLQSIR